MNDQIPIIHQDPFGVVVAFDADGEFASRFYLKVDFVADSLILPYVVSGTNQEVIRETGDLFQIEDYEILCFLRLCCPDGREPSRFRHLRCVCEYWSLRGIVVLPGDDASPARIVLQYGKCVYLAYL